MSHRFLAGQIDRATHRSVVMYRLRPTLKAGIEVNQAVGEIGVVANWTALRETTRRPALVVGTSSDRIGTPEGQSYYVTLSKSLHHELRIPIAPYLGASYSEYEQRVLFPWGINVRVAPRWSAMVLNDGVHTHLSTTYSPGRVSFTLLAIERRNLGITIGTTF